MVGHLTTMKESHLFVKMVWEISLHFYPSCIQIDLRVKQFFPLGKLEKKFFSLKSTKMIQNILKWLGVSPEGIIYFKCLLKVEKERKRLWGQKFESWEGCVIFLLVFFGSLQLPVKWTFCDTCPTSPFPEGWWMVLEESRRLGRLSLQRNSFFSWHCFLDGSGTA